MKHLKSINEYNRTVGFRYSEPREKYKITLLCKGEDITEDKIKEGLSKVSTLTYDEESIEVLLLDEDTLFDLPDGPVEVNAVVLFDVTIYNEKEVYGITSELNQNLSKFNIDISDFKIKFLAD
jgi:hypothetical protein